MLWHPLSTSISRKRIIEEISHRFNWGTEGRSREGEKNNTQVGQKFWCWVTLLDTAELS